MNLISIKEQIKDTLVAIWDKIQEHQAYGQLLEFYDSLPSPAQKASLFTVAALLIYLLLSIPMGFTSSSNEHLEEFQSNRVIIRGLLKTTQLNKKLATFRSGPSESLLIDRLRSIVSKQGFLENQIGDIKSFDASPLNLGPRSIEKAGAEAHLMKLNINEIITLGYQLQKLSSGVKLIGMEVTPSDDKENYFDANFKLVSFILPRKSASEDTKDSRSRSGKPLKKRTQRSKK